MSIPFVGARRFMPLGTTSFSRMDIPFSFDLKGRQEQIQQKNENFVNSFSLESQKATLPDIFTTCPELRTFKLPLTINQPVVENEFNLPRPAQKVYNLPPAPTTISPRNVQIQVPQQQIYMKFEPNLPIIRPYVLLFNVYFLPLLSLLNKTNV